MRTAVVLLVAGALGCANPVVAQTASDSPYTERTDNALEAALTIAVEAGRPADFQRLLLTETVFVPITETSYQALAAARQAGDTPSPSMPVEFFTFSIDGGTDRVLFFTSPAALRSVVGQRFWISAPGKRALSMLPRTVALAVMDDSSHQATFTPVEIQQLLSLAAP